MVFKSRYVLLAVGTLALASIPFAAKANTVSYGFQGAVADRDDFLVLFQFTISEDSEDVFLATLSNGGGVFDPAAAPYGGVTLAPGGFQTQLFLFTSDGYPSGTFAVCGQAGGDACLGTDRSNFTYSTLDLKAGTYTLALVEAGNEPMGNLSDGWSYDDPINIPGGGPFPNPTTGGHFNSNYSVEILNVDGATQLPEPGGFGLFGVGMALIALAFFRLKRARLVAAVICQDRRH